MYTSNEILTTTKILLIVCLILVIGVVSAFTLLENTELDYKQPIDSSFTETQKITILDYKVPKDSTFTVTNKEYYGVAD